MVDLLDRYIPVKGFIVPSLLAILPYQLVIDNERREVCKKSIGAAHRSKYISKSEWAELNRIQLILSHIWIDLVDGLEKLGYYRIPWIFVNRGAECCAPEEGCHSDVCQRDHLDETGYPRLRPPFMYCQLMSDNRHLIHKNVKWGCISQLKKKTTEKWTLQVFSSYKS